MKQHDAALPVRPVSQTPYCEVGPVKLHYLFFCLGGIIGIVYLITGLAFSPDPAVTAKGLATATMIVAMAAYFRIGED
jgi:hypothetical protein